MAPRALYPALLGLSGIPTSSALVFTQILTPSDQAISLLKRFLSPIPLLKALALLTAPPFLAWAAVVTGLTLSQTVRRHGIYMHKLISKPREVDEPERWGFQHKQVVPFRLPTQDGERLSAWLVCPPALYRQHRDAITESSGSWDGGLTSDVTATANFRLLRDDPSARLVLYFHGNGGTLAYGWRPSFCQTVSSLDASRLHVLAVDPRGYGASTGVPSQSGLLRDAIAAFEWAVDKAKVPPRQIVIVGHSLGGGVALMLARHLATREPTPVAPAGIVTIGAFSSAADTLSELWIEGLVPTLQPLAWCRLWPLYNFLKGLFSDLYPNKDWVAEIVRRAPRCHIAFVHAENDEVVGPQHADVLFWTAVNSASGRGISVEEVEGEKARRGTELGKGGWMVEWQTEKEGCVVREVKPVYGGHAQLMTFPFMAAEVMRAFEAVERG